MSLQTARTSEVPAAWRAIMKGYQTSDTFRSIAELAVTLVPYIALWVLMYWSLSVSYWLTLALSVPTALFMVRVFVIMHDCGHGSFFPEERANNRVGAILGVLVWTPYRQWTRAHAMHHATSGNLDRRGFGDVWTLTVRQYRESSLWVRVWYRIYRNPAFLFLFGAPFNFLVLHRTRFSSFGDTEGNGKRERVSVHGTTLVLIAYVTGMISLLGWRKFLLIQVPVLYVASVIGVWLFYVQHQFENTYWRRQGEWDYVRACLRGSSFYKLPRWLQWWTAHIGIHHVHHLNARIPFYRLRKAYEENPWLQTSPTLTLWTSLRSLFLRLWDEKRGCMVSFAKIR